MLRIILLSIFAVPLFLTQANAISGLDISPKYIRQWEPETKTQVFRDVMPGEIVSDAVVVSNYNDSDKDIILSFGDTAKTSDGSFGCAPPGDVPSSSLMASVVAEEEKMELVAGEERVVNFTFTAPEVPGEYNGCISIMEDIEKQISTRLAIRMRVFVMGEIKREMFPDVDSDFVYVTNRGNVSENVTVHIEEYNFFSYSFRNIDALVLPSTTQKWAFSPRRSAFGGLKATKVAISSDGGKEKLPIKWEWFFPRLVRLSVLDSSSTNHAKIH